MDNFSIKNIGVEFGRMRRESLEIINARLFVQSDKLVEELIHTTPVDTGLARKSWKKEIVDTPLGAMSVLSNDAPYINFLNQGSSKQAPAYFVESTALKYGTPVGTIVDNK